MLRSCLLLPGLNSFKHKKKGETRDWGDTPLPTYSLGCPFWYITSLISVWPFRSLLSTVFIGSSLPETPIALRAIRAPY